MARSKTDLYIRILRRVLDSAEPVAISQIALKLKLDPEEYSWLNEEADSGGKVFWRRGKNDCAEHLMVLSMKGRQILLDHEALEDTRDSSQKAMKVAIAALVVAIASVILNIYEVRKPDLTIGSEMQSNKLLQGTLDPAAPLAGAKAPPASSAPEPRRWVAGRGSHK